MAFTVTYDGNGSDGGTVPVDPNSYNAGDTVAVANLATIIKNASLTKTGAVLAYWNTKQDGSGDFHGWPQDTSFKMPAANVILYAQWFVTTGLTNGGATANSHYKFYYDSTLQSSGLEPGRTNTVIQNAEADYNIMANWFKGVTPAGPSPIPVYVTRLSGGANNTGDIRLKPGTNSPNELRCLLVSEVTESFMQGQNKGWGFLPGVNNEESCGEALSLFLTQQFAVGQGFPNPYTAFTANTANNWLNSSLPASNSNSTRLFNDGGGAYDYGSRFDYVNSVLNRIGNGPGTGCSILFIYYLLHQFGFTIEEIIANAPGFTNGQLNATGTLRGVYQNLTGDSSDPFPFFSRLLDTAFPPDQVSSISGPNPDDPWPIGLVSFAMDRNSFGKDEVSDTIGSGSVGSFPEAFWLTLEGFNRQTYGGALPTLFGPATGLAGVSLTANPKGIEFERPGDSKAPQRIRFPYDVNFTAAALPLFPPKGTPPVEEQLNGRITVLGRTFTASTLLQLVYGANPYFTNVNTDIGNQSWLSQDLRIFTSTPRINDRPIPGGPAFVSDDVNGAYQYIQDLLRWLNNHYSDPSQIDPFIPQLNVIPGQIDAYTADNSVSPSIGGRPNYSFAIARVRMRGPQGPAGEAKNVRVFFRLWSTQTADTDFQPSAYPSHFTAGNPDWPLAASDGHTIPFFATGNAPNLSDPNNLEYGIDGINNKTIRNQAGDRVWVYYGCFLNFYDPSFLANNVPVPTLLTGTHHCLVAQIAFDDAPIVNANGITESPDNSDKLAQRNLQITFSDNPGPPSTHLIPQTFDIRPSPAPVFGQDLLLSYPDELMIDWGNTPVGSTADIYWPQADASLIVDTANHLYGGHRLSVFDPKTIRCEVTGGITYVPIPSNVPDNLAGLLTVNLPTSIVTGEEFNVILRRVSSRRVVDTPPPHIASRKVQAKPKAEAPTVTEINWRYIVGTFQVKIPVSTANIILPYEEDTLAIMKWRLSRMLPSNRWYPVLLRYISYIEARIRGLGGNPDSIAPSLTGAPQKPIVPCDEIIERTGKVIEVIYDCFGDFEGFVLRDCSCSHTIKSREAGIEKLILHACHERVTVSVLLDRHHETIRKFILRC